MKKIIFKFLLNKKIINKRKKEINTLSKIDINDDIAISIQHLTKYFPSPNGDLKTALDDVSFNIKKGEFHGFIGNNGAGKTTTIRSILGFYSSFIGKIYINGKSSNDYKIKNCIGYIPESANFPKILSAKDYLISLAQIHKIKKETAINEIEKLAFKIGIDSSELNKSPYFMSSGQKKKIMLIQALINKPEILILDEPASNLDPTARKDLFEVLKKINMEGTTILISSHILLELEKFIDSYTVLDDGKVIESISIKEKLKKLEYNKYLILADWGNFIEFVKNKNIKHEFSNNVLQLKINLIEESILLKEIAKNNYEIVEFANNKIDFNKLYFEK
ncbi:ABC transporter ATP-binding protein [Mycoplasmopsis meleagridis]|uniref:ABC transporter ATP-binding protein n=1 Tax=Mycoplasmopsis meleagridis TaxID=29561 RepID=UPI0009E7FC0B|nr:ABC transporter ATP-binding protein [Mycoplasmopsis meleagridis]